MGMTSATIRLQNFPARPHGLCAPGPNLFAMSIRDNIRFANPDISDDLVKKYAAGV